MSDEVTSYINKGKKFMDDSIEHLQKELSKIRAGKASPNMLSGIMVDYYGTPTPISQVANITTPDGRTLALQPWEKKMLGPIEQAIFKANLGLTPMNDGEFVRIIIPPLTEDRRKALVKQSKASGEEAKVSIRQGRQKLMDFIKKAVKDGFPEDMGKRREDEVQKIVNSYNGKVDQIVAAKDKDIMTI